MIWNQPATTLELLSFNLAAQREKSLAVSKKNWNQVTTAITNNMFRLLQKVNSAYTIFLSNIQALTATLGVHWQASRRIESIMPAPYPWLSGIMAACYYFALAVWLGELLVSLYHYCVVDFAVKRSVSALTLAALSWALDRAVPYTLGQGWRFATLLVLILLVVFAAMT